MADWFNNWWNNTQQMAGLPITDTSIATQSAVPVVQPTVPVAQQPDYSYTRKPTLVNTELDAFDAVANSINLQPVTGPVIPTQPAGLTVVPLYTEEQAALPSDLIEQPVEMARRQIAPQRQINTPQRQVATPRARQASRRVNTRASTGGGRSMKPYSREWKQALQEAKGRNAINNALEASRQELANREIAQTMQGLIDAQSLIDANATPKKTRYWDDEYNKYVDNRGFYDFYARAGN